MLAELARGRAELGRDCAESTATVLGQVGAIASVGAEKKKQGGKKEKEKERKEEVSEMR
mgnify:CR=1 FL=1